MVIVKTFNKLLVTVALMCGLASTAQANVPVFEATGSTQGGTLVDSSFSFLINQPGWYQATLTDNVAPEAFQTLTLGVLPGLTHQGVFLGGVSGPGTFSFLANTTGAYTALLFGVPGGAAGAGSFGISVVPEVETWVMLLVGMGLLAYQLRRKNKGGPQGLSFA